MPRTRARNAEKVMRQQRSDNQHEVRIKEMEIINEEFKNKSSLKWEKRSDHISELFDSFRNRLGEKLNYTMDEMKNGQSTQNSESMVTNTSNSMKDDGNDFFNPKRPVGPLAQSRRRNKSVTGTTVRNINRTGQKSDTTNQRASRCKFRTPANRLVTMSADRNVMKPVTPKIQMNTPFSMFRHARVGETIISMSGSPILVMGGAIQNTANINIPTANGIFSMNPTTFSEVDANLVPHISGDTLMQLKQLQDNLSVVMSTVSSWCEN